MQFLEESKFLQGETTIKFEEGSAGRRKAQKEKKNNWFKAANDEEI